MVGAPIWNSPEIMFEEKWNTATDIWSFGAVVSTLLWSASTAAEIC
jgi:serine/threonine protein kinase